MKNISKILKLSRPLYRQISVLSFILLLLSVLGLVQPFLTKYIVDDIQAQITTGSGNISRIAFLMGLMLGVNLISSVFNSLSMRFGDYVSSRFRKFLAEEFYKKIFTLPQKYFDSEISGKMLNQLNRGISSIQDFIGMLTNFVLPALFQSIFTIGILFYYSRIIGFLSFAIFPVYILISSYSTKRWGKEEVKKNKLEDISRGRIQEVVSNIRLVRGFMTQKTEWKFVSDTLKKVNIIYDKQSTTYHILNFLREFGLELVLVVISLLVFRNTFLGLLTLGEMVLILQLINQLRRPLFAMSFILERVQAAESGSKEYFEVMDLPEEEAIISQKTSRKKIDQNPTIEFRKVGFQYEKGGAKVLRNVGFTIPAGQTVALVGHSGAGKTTLINLLLKFYKPTTGEIYISGKPYSKLTHEYIRSHISLVFQENELFSTTVRENVAYGIKNPSDKEIIEALKKANAYDFVQKLKGGLDAQIGERGVKLSGGQKQRMQIARAIMHDRPILVLDEATSNLDSKSEKLVQDALENLTKDKLVIVIAHRFSTIQNADRILVLDEGKVADDGSPSKLARKKGVYSELLQYQIEGNQKLLSKYELR